MTKKWTSGSVTIICAIAALLIAACFLVRPTFAQQNGTTCPETYNDGTGRTYYLFLDEACGNTGPYRQEYYSYQGYGDHNGCYYDLSGDYSFQVDATCSPCPSNWQKCTPCSNNALECGADTPDPKPTGTLFHKFVHFIDWLTA